MPAFSEYFGNAARNRRRIFPGLAEYYITPTRENARALLVSLRLPVPYAARIQSAAATSAAAAARRVREIPAAPPDDLFTIKSDSSSSGGGRRRSRRARPNKYTAPLQALEPRALFAAHRLIDLLHDILKNPPVAEVLESLYNIAALPAVVTDELTRLVNEVWKDESAASRINHRLTDVAEALAGLFSPRAHALAFKPDHTLVATEMDLYLLAAVSRWYSKPSLEIVLDGVFREVALPRADRIGADDAAAVNTDVNDEDVARSLTLCAYLQLVMTDWDTANLAVNSVTAGPTGIARASRATHATRIKTKEILFLVGDFQELDIPGADRFIKKWISYIRAETAYLSHLPPTAVATRSVAVADLPSLSDTPFANVAVNLSGLRVKLTDRPNATSAAMRRAISKGTFVPYCDKRARTGRTESAPQAQTQRMPRRSAQKPSSAEVYQPEFCTANKKKWLRSVFLYYGYELAPTPESEVFIETLAIVNAFRDALRAEVALARDAVYITIDALALVYYQARADRTADRGTATAAATGVKHSNGLMIHPDGPEDLAITYSAPTIPTSAAPRGT